MRSTRAAGARRWLLLLLSAAIGFTFATWAAWDPCAEAASREIAQVDDEPRRGGGAASPRRTTAVPIDHHIEPERDVARVVHLVLAVVAVAVDAHADDAVGAEVMANARKRSTAW